MAHGGDLLALGEDLPSERNFELAFRGYKTDQVDKCVRLLEAESATIAAERDEAFAQAHALAAQVQQLQLELVEARQRPSGSTTVTTNASFRHLGERVGQILALAEDDRAAAARRTELEAEAARVQDYVDRLQGEADAALATAQQEARRVTDQAAAQAEQLKAEAEAYAAHHRAAVEHETVQRRAALEAELASARAQGEQVVAAMRAEAERILNAAKAEADHVVGNARAH